jgi:hypothetical protein
MKNILLFILLCGLTLEVFTQVPVYSRVKIYTGTKTREQLMATGLEIIKANPAENWYIAEISQDEISVVRAAGFRCDILIPDMEKYYTERFLKTSKLTESDNLLVEAWPQPVNFSLGSCGGFSTINEMLSQLDLMHTLYPSLISVKHPISDSITTAEGRNIYYVRISDNPDVKENEPEVLYTGMHHAREPIGMQHLLYYMWYLLENYNSDPAIKDLVDHTEMYFVPVFNVDGYAYNITTKPIGGGLWRKNRRYNGGSYGVDINRNYGYKWGNDDNGSSAAPSSDIYRGAAPFSEPETRMMKYFCESHNFRIALNYHSYAGLFLYAWGWSPDLCPDDQTFEAYATLMTRENGYSYGPGCTTIYPTNGGSDDWMYGDTTSKPAILSYTPEVGNDNDGFWPQQSRIAPLCRENMFASITAARLVGNYGTIADKSPLFISKQTGYLPFEVKRLGMQNGDFPVSVIPLGTAFASAGTGKLIQGLKTLEVHADSIAYQLSNSVKPGDTIQYVLALNNRSFSEYDTVTRIFGYPVTVFKDDCSDISNWSGTWELSGEKYYSPSSCITDSPSGNYASYANKTIELVDEIELISTIQMVLEFRATWALEKGYDFVQLSISTDNGTTWTPLSGQYTHKGTANQALDQPVYDGTMKQWTHEIISLKPYMGKRVKFRFRLKADPATEMDGYYFDDFIISMLFDPTAVSETDQRKSIIGIPYPNPADQSFGVSYNLPGTTSNNFITITSVTGTILLKNRLPGQAGIVNPDISFLPPGVYFIRISSDGYQSAVRKIVVR